MSNDGQSDAGRLSSAEEEAIFASPARASQSEAPEEPDRGRVSAISSGPFEISPPSLSSPPASTNGPPSAVVQNALERGRPQLPLSAIVGIAAAIFLVLVLLSLLLFR